MAKKAGILLAGVCILIAWGLHHSVEVYSGFWAAFWPSLWANVIGVSIAAVFGIPVGFAINHYVLKLSEDRKRRAQATEARDILQHVRAEINLHPVPLRQLEIFFPASAFLQESQTRRTQIPAIPEIATLLLSNVHGRRAISFRSMYEVGESLVVFEVSNYYARVEELNRMLTFSIQYPTQSGWDRAMNSLMKTLWVAQGQVVLEIDQAIERLGKRATQ